MPNCKLGPKLRETKLQDLAGVLLAGPPVLAHDDIHSVDEDAVAEVFAPLLNNPNFLNDTNSLCANPAPKIRTNIAPNV
jgi:hypothetical protein